MTAHMKTIAMSVTLIVTSRILFAADEAQHPCAQLRNDTERLACYDQAFGKPAAAAAATAAAPKEQFGFTEKELARNTGQSAAPAAPETSRQRSRRSTGDTTESSW